MIPEDRSPVEITDLKSLDDAIDDSSTRFRLVQPYWRGHADWQWPLRAKVFRNLAYKETSLLRYFMTLGESRTRDCPTYGDFVGWLMLAQHFGLPTRLMDWSLSPLVALYFAIQEDPSCNTPSDGCLWSIDPGLLNKQMIDSHRLLSPDEPEVQRLVSPAFAPNPVSPPEDNRRIIAIGTREIDPRVLVQQGVFTLHADNVDMASVPYTVTPWRRAFLIPSATKAGLRARLRNLGFNKSTLFPDLGALAEELTARSFQA
jgi:hypothetical protein